MYPNLAGARSSTLDRSWQGISHQALFEDALSLQTRLMSSVSHGHAQNIVRSQSREACRLFGQLRCGIACSHFCYPLIVLASQGQRRTVECSEERQPAQARCAWFAPECFEDLSSAFTLLQQANRFGGNPILPHAK